jgi:type I restriction enzyme R subunit
MDRLRARLRAKEAAGEAADRDLERLREMQATDMAVVVSQAQNEVADLAAKGLDIRPHRARMEAEDLDARFKDPDDPLRIVFVCAMWMTGFDVPTCATMYLDKPMRNHTLMQTIARANRVVEGKHSGLIVDYAGVFRHLQDALALYAPTRDDLGGAAPETPIRRKDELVEQLREAVKEARAFLHARGVEPDAIHAADGFDRVQAMGDAVEALLERDDTRRATLAHARHVDALFRAILPDPAASAFGLDRTLLVVLAQRLRALDPEVDVSDVRAEIERVLDASVAAEPYVIRDPSDRVPATTGDPAAPYRDDGRIDLSALDVEALRAQFEQGRKRTEAARLQRRVARTVRAMVQRNRTRMDYLETFQSLIDAYNMGSQNVEVFFQQLLGFMDRLRHEEARAAREGVSEEALAVADAVAEAAGDLSAPEWANVKAAACALLPILKRDVLTLDWRARQTARAAVRVAIRNVLDAHLPARYEQGAFQAACDAVYAHVYAAYPSAEASIYAAPEG